MTQVTETAETFTPEQLKHLRTGNNPPRETGQTVNIDGLIIPAVEVEPCYRLSQIGRGEPVTCACTCCRYRKAQESKVEPEPAITYHLTCYRKDGQISSGISCIPTEAEARERAKYELETFNYERVELRQSAPENMSYEEFLQCRDKFFIAIIAQPETESETESEAAKVPVLSVELFGAEVDTTNHDRRHIVNSIEAANSILRRWASYVKQGEGYQIAAYTVYFVDGNKYSGEYKLTADDTQNADIAKHMRDYCEFHGGLKKPEWMSDWSYRKMLETDEVISYYFADLVERYEF